MERSGETLQHGELACDLPFAPSTLEGVEAADALERDVMVLFEQYRAPLLRYALSFGVPVADGEEIVQEVFLSLFRHLQLGRPRHNLQGWIFRVAHNLTLRQRYTNRRLLDVAETDTTLVAIQPDPGPNPEECCAEAQRQRCLLAVVEALPQVDRSCLWLRAEGLRYREIAAAVGISLGSVSMSLARSLARLARADQGADKG